MYYETMDTSENDLNFHLHIRMGNDAMRSHLDLARTLVSVADNIEYGGSEGKIFDSNGNNVGNWSIS